MAGLHVLSTSADGISVVLHLAVPATNNPVGTAWRTALVNSGLGGTTTLRDGDGTAGTISAAEKATIVAGAVYERAGRFPANADFRSEGGAAKNADLDAWVTAQTSSALTELQEALRYFGATRS